MFGFFSPLYFLVRALTSKKREDSLMEQAYDCRKKGDLGKAITLYTQAIETGTNTWVVYFYRGECKLAASDMPGAIADFEKAIEVNPKYSGKAKQALEAARRTL